MISKASQHATEQTYYYAHNWRGDVVALYDSTGALFATYDYDAWGNILSVKDANGDPITGATSFAIANPFRYRGYYYDRDSGLYYLQSRYYDPTTGRFVNADKIENLNLDWNVFDLNIFTYCNNNPCINCDKKGEWVSSILGFTIQGGAIIGAAFSIYWVIDSLGNQGLYIVSCFSWCLPCAGITASWFHSWRNTIFDLNGFCMNIGASFGKGASFGVDALFDKDGLCGFQFNMGVGVAYPIDIHINPGAGIVIPLGKKSYMSTKVFKRIKFSFKRTSKYSRKGR